MRKVPTTVSVLRSRLKLVATVTPQRGDGAKKNRSNAPRTMRFASCAGIPSRSPAKNQKLVWVSRARETIGGAQSSWLRATSHRESDSRRCGPFHLPGDDDLPPANQILLLVPA